MTYTEAAAWLRAHDRYLILTHKRPDGDTIGCAAALCRGLRGLGKNAHICPGTGETHLFTPYLEGLLAPEGYEPETVSAWTLPPGACLPHPVSPGWSGGSIWLSTTTPPRSSLPRRPAWTPGGLPAGRSSTTF